MKNEHFSAVKRNLCECSESSDETFYHFYFIFRLY